MSKKHFIMLLTVAALSLFAFMSSAKAEIVYEYDFSRCQLGDLDQNDNWTTTDHSSTKFVYVKNSAPPTPMSGNYLDWASTTFNQGVTSYRPNNIGWKYEIPADTDFELTVLSRVGASHIALGARMGLAPGVSETALIALGSRMGFGSSRYNLQWRIPGYAGNVGTANYYLKLDTTSVGIWMIGMYFESKGSNLYDVKLWYEKTPGNIATRINAATITGITLDMTVYDTLQTNVCSYSTSYPNVEMDNMRIWVSQVPEPSTLVLLATGLVGLIAYAWRKRK